MAYVTTTAVYEREGGDGIVRVEEKVKQFKRRSYKYVEAYRMGEIDDLANGGTTEVLVKSGAGMLYNPRRDE